MPKQRKGEEKEQEPAKRSKICGSITEEVKRFFVIGVYFYAMVFCQISAMLCDCLRLKNVGDHLFNKGERFGDRI